MLWKHKFLIVIVWAAVSAVAVFVVHGLPPVYTAEALILVDSQKIPEKFVSSTVSTDLQDRIASIRQQILSTARLKTIIDNFDLYRDYRKTHFEEEVLETMSSDIKITLERGWTGDRPGAFRVGYQGSEPTVVPQVANRIANLFIEENLKTREVEAEGTSEFMETQLQEAKKILDELESGVSAYKLQHNGELPQQESLLGSTLSRLEVELESNRESMNRAQSLKVTLESTMSALESTLALMARPVPAPAPAQNSQPGTSSPAAGEPAKRQLLSEVLQAKLDTFRLQFRDSMPEIQSLQDLIAQTKAKEAREAKEAEKTAETASVQAAPPPAPSGAPTPKSAASENSAVLRSPEYRQAEERLSGLKAQMFLADQELTTGKTNELRIRKDIATYQAQLGRLPIREQEMAKLTRDYEISKSNYKTLLEKKQAAEMSTDMERRAKSERFTLLDPARVPEKPTKPNRPVFYSVGIALGLVIGLVCGVGFELKKSVLLGEWELPPGTNILGTLPYIAVAPMGEKPSASAKGSSGSRRRAAVISSALFLIVATGTAVYFWSHRF